MPHINEHMLMDTDADSQQNSYYSSCVHYNACIASLMLNRDNIYMLFSERNMGHTIYIVDAIFFFFLSIFFIYCYVIFFFTSMHDLSSSL